MSLETGKVQPGLFSKVQTFAQAGVNFAQNAVTNKVAQAVKGVWSLIGDKQYIFQAARRATQTVTDSVMNSSLKIAAKVAIRKFDPETKIANYQTQLKNLTGSDKLSMAVTQAVPVLVEKCLPLIGDNRFQNLLRSDKELSDKMAEYKLLEMLVKVAENTKGFSVTNGDGTKDYFLSTLLANLLNVAVPYLRGSDIQVETLKADLTPVANQLMGSVRQFVGVQIDKTLLGKESEQNQTGLNSTKTFVVEMLKNFNISMEDTQSIEGALLGIVKHFVQDGVTKLLFQANEKLQDFNETLDSTELAKRPLNQFMKDICKTGAEETTRKVVDEIVKTPSGLQAKSAVEAQKNIIQETLEKIFTIAMKWVLNLLGVIDKEGNLSPQHEWMKNLVRPIRIFKNFWNSLQEAEKIEDQEKRSERIQHLFENLMEDLIGDSFASWLLRWFENLAAEKGKE